MKRLFAILLLGLALVGATGVPAFANPANDQRTDTPAAHTGIPCQGLHEASEATGSVHIFEVDLEDVPRGRVRVALVRKDACGGTPAASPSTPPHRLATSSKPRSYGPVVD